MSNSVTPRTLAHQAVQSMGFPRQEYWSGMLFPSLGALSEPGIEPESPALQADSLLLNHQERLRNDNLYLGANECYYLYTCLSKNLIFQRRKNIHGIMKFISRNSNLILEFYRICH